MRLPRMRITLRRMMAVVALAALVLGFWRWTRKETPTPEARALEIALSVPTSSDYEATAIYQAAIFQETISPGALTKLAELPRVKLSQITDGRPLPLSWSVEVIV